MNSRVLSSYQGVLCGLVWMLAPVSLLADTVEGKGWFVEVDVADVEAFATVSGFSLHSKAFDDKETGTTLRVGYAFNEYFALQGGYHDFGDHYGSDCAPGLLCLVQNTDRVDIDALSVAAVGTWPISDYVELYAKLGVMHWDANFRRFDRDDSGQDLVYGAGIGFRFVPNWRLNLAYEEVDFDIESLGLGLQYRF